MPGGFVMKKKNLQQISEGGGSFAGPNTWKAIELFF